MTCLPNGGIKNEEGETIGPLEGSLLTVSPI
jgi:hypothetical protein